MVLAAYPSSSPVCPPAVRPTPSVFSARGADLHPVTRELADGANYAAISTLLPSEVRGRVVETDDGDAARAQIDELSQKYDGQPYPADNITSGRVIVWIEPERQTIAG